MASKIARAKAKKAKAPAGARAAGKKSAAKKSRAKKPAKAAAQKTDVRHGTSASKLIPPPGGAAVRMYRIGHGDCFLIAFAGEKPDKPVHVLIDCGYKPKSPEMLAEPTDVAKIGQDILDTTGGFVDVAIVTHEHQDHVNGFRPDNFPDLKVGEVWFAWTENPKDKVANKLRRKFHDRLLRLVDTRASLMGLGNAAAAEDVDWYLEFELGEPSDQYNGLPGGAAAAAGGAKDPSRSANKVAMKFLRDCAPGEPKYLYPHEKVRAVPGAKSARAFVLGPPRDIEKIDDLDPEGDEEFGQGFGMAQGAAAATTAATATTTSPFQTRHAIPLAEAFADPRYADFYKTYYGNADAPDAGDDKEVISAASWRRLTADDAADACALALAMNNATNNASLALAFELSMSGKVLLFIGDAQAGNWRSWSDGEFDDDGTKVTATDLLERTVLYKVGHHGSHNATLNGKAGSGHPCLAEMAKGENAAEFVAMITAVEKWAHQKPKPNWNHPLPAIKAALVEKAGGRVLQTDSKLPESPSSSGAANWPSFVDSVRETSLYFDLMIGL